MLAALATTADATAFGLTVTDAALLRASVRVRAFVRQQISAGTSTVTLRGPVSRLPQRPVTAVTSVLDEYGVTVAHELGANGVLTVNTVDLVTVVYVHGFATIPDEVIEIVCTIAARLGSSGAAGDSLAAGVQQEQSGSASQTFGWDAWKGLSSLTSEEKAALLRHFPRIPGPAAVMRP